ncbi:hypothetical protein CLV78_102144 [Aliiruegeria haliotis]|uniref:Protease inhibitor Inh n=1 Tax=Aliiruegeria haliotis TaxID=1280846 RepID=A0A2T0RUY9_9RHOB|nr:hypothetical protein [Aliiruegeria haliotis]PRY24970.1 hypothetical protein CLV78_102144 [Aliiruegeria haliotis]
MRLAMALICLGLGATPVAAQNFTTAAEVKPILGMQKDRWVAVREFDGQDLVYFTAVLSWRCGLDGIFYGLNGAAPEVALDMEPCHEGTPAPNALTGEGHEIYITAPLGSVESISLRLVFDDGTTEEGRWDRAAVLMP